jgi:signal transduction histidine kinase
MKTHEKIHGGDNSVVLGSRSCVSRSDDAAVSSGRLDPIRLVADCEDRLHAVRSGLAGVAGALHVLAEQHGELPADLRERLEAMLVAEVARLQRLVEPGSGDQQVRPGPELLDVDRVLADVVLARRSAGQEVAWAQTGHTVWGRYDDLVEVLNILLVNAWRHGAGAPARIQVAEATGRVTIAVSDDGPGVPDQLRETIFERGVRRTSSPGQGLGLAMARELVSELGGTLVLAGNGLTGARFEIAVPAAALHGAA